MLSCRTLFESESVEFDDSLSSTNDFVQLLAKHKGLLISRKDNPLTVNDFSDLVSKKLRFETYPYIGGAAPRRVILADEITGEPTGNLTSPISKP